MCEICLSSPCKNLCPNAPEPKIVFECSGCSGLIREGDDYWDIMSEQWCEECINRAHGVAEYETY